MQIFIDESGIFAPHKGAQQWSSIGAVTVPEDSLPALESALSRIKSAHHINPDKEFPKNNRPDCSSNAFYIFLEELNSAGCTLQICATNGSPLEDEGLERHRKDTVKATEAYAKKFPAALAMAEETTRAITQLSPQQYNQCIIQVHLIAETLTKIISYYSKQQPKALASFTWIIDRKDGVETRFETVFKTICAGLLSSQFASHPPPLQFGPGHDYLPFANAFSPVEAMWELVETTKRLHEVDLSDLANHLMAVDLGSLVRGDLRLENSEKNAGIQVADLLVSSTNRCLKRNFTDNKKVATALGRLMINSPSVDGRALSISGHRPTAPLTGEVASLVQLMDDSSKKLFSEAFRENYSQRSHSRPSQSIQQTN